MHYDTFPPIETDAARVQGRGRVEDLLEGGRARTGRVPHGVGSTRALRPPRGGTMGSKEATGNAVEDRAGGLPGDLRSRADGGGRPDGRGEAAHLRGALPALGAPAVADPGARLHPRPRGLERADRRGRALPAHVRALRVLHRRAESRRGARPDHARRAHRGPANLPLHADRRRGPPRALLRALLPRGRRARVRRPHGDARRDLRAPQRGLRAALRRDAQSSAPTGSPPSRRTPRRWSRR